jgi:hypothetical protein
VSGRNKACLECLTLVSTKSGRDRKPLPIDEDCGGKTTVLSVRDGHGGFVAHDFSAPRAEQIMQMHRLIPR